MMMKLGSLDRTLTRVESRREFIIQVSEDCGPTLEMSMGNVGMRTQDHAISLA